MKKQTEFKLNKRDSLWFQDNSAAVNIAYAKEVCDLAILPIGAIEQHGPHCPCGSDSFNAMGIAEAVAEKSGAMILACPMYGSHPAHHWGMPGTIPLTFETHVGLLTDIIRGAANAGYNKFLIISAHGQTMSMFEAVHKAGIEGYFTIGSTWYDFLRDNKKTLDPYIQTKYIWNLLFQVKHTDSSILNGKSLLVRLLEKVCCITLKEHSHFLKKMTFLQVLSVILPMQARKKVIRS